MKHELTGMVLGVYIAPDPQDLQSMAQEALEMQIDGVAGDRHFGVTMKSNSRTPHYTRGTLIRNSRQVSLLSVEELDEIARRLGVPAIQPEWLGANIVLAGIPELSHLPPSTRLLFPGNAALGIDGQNYPCKGPAQIIQANYPDTPGLEQAFRREAMELRGIVGWVERPGRICPGDSVRVLLPDAKPYPY